MMESLLIANRGEIACRIIRTAHGLGIRTIAVYSEADRDALHVQLADDAVCIGPPAAAESYLQPQKILQAAAATGAQAIHPGYGFLSENPDFAEAVQAAGLRWVGPPAAAIRAMGLKDAAKKLMAAADVPVTPGYLGDDQRAERLAEEAAGIGFPVLIKAVAGGGGKGMRRVDDPEGFADALASCRREAAASFGDDRVLLEKYVLNPRHIEVQVFADQHGQVVHLFERDCSLQRRHQKVIEEAPAPGMDAQTRKAVCGAAVKAAQAVGYQGAGTVEFIADASAGLRADRIWFMEMNTRLQVEHPVTEAITGVDLVEWQLRVASGEPLPKTQDALSITGHAIEARLYAENPVNEFLPSTGPLAHLRMPAGLRIDTGVQEGDTVTPYYDPMVAKLIVHRPSRQAAAAALARGCAQVQVWPVKTNAAFLARALAHPQFVAGELCTGFIEQHLSDLLPATDPAPAVLQAAALSRRAEWTAPRLPGNPSDPWSQGGGFRLNSGPHIEVGLQTSTGKSHQVQVPTPAPGARQCAPHLSTIQLGDTHIVFDAGYPHAFTAPQALTAGGAGGSDDGSIRAHMPGRIITLVVGPGDTVTKGQALVTMEAMKMEHTLKAPFDGEVADLAIALGDQVTEGSVLLRITRSS